MTTNDKEAGAARLAGYRETQAIAIKQSKAKAAADRIGKIAVDWSEGKGGYSFTADLTDYPRAQELRRAFTQAGFKYDRRDRSRWTVRDIDNAAETFQSLAAQGHPIHHDGLDGYMILDRIERHQRNGIAPQIEDEADHGARPKPPTRR